MPRRERPLGRALDDRTVRQRIRERHADLEHVGAGTIECARERRGARQRRVASCDIGHEPGAFVVAQARKGSMRDDSSQRLHHTLHVLVAAARQVHEDHCVVGQRSCASRIV